MTDLPDLRRLVREIFAETLSGLDAGRAVRRAIRLDNTHLKIVDTVFDLSAQPASIYSIAIGKAAAAMAATLDDMLGSRLVSGVLSSPPTDIHFSDRWRLFTGGHPVPTAASLEAAQAAFALLQRAGSDPTALIIFLISGGGSAMIEWPRDEQMTLAELSEANRVLVSCGASIIEINAVRRAISSVKGGGLSARAPLRPQVSLIISDTGRGEEASVASGPTFAPPPRVPDAAQVVARYDLASSLPATVRRAVDRSVSERKEPRHRVSHEVASAPHRHYVLLDNECALEQAARLARARGCAVELAIDLSEQHVAEGSAALIERTTALWRERRVDASAVCLISGGEFACPVTGSGTGGRNAETALRCALEMESRAESLSARMPRMVALSGGTDGIDGNSPAAGAIADHTTLRRARARGLDARAFLSASDAYSFFAALDDALITGPTGTNVRDLRIMLAG